MPKWEIGETYKTVNGLDAKLIYRMDDEQKRPLVFIITERDGSQFITQRDELGRVPEDQLYRRNVVPPEPKKTSKFFNVCDGIVHGQYLTYDDAIRYPFKDRIGVLEIQFENDDYVGTVFHPANKGEDK